MSNIAIFAVLPPAQYFPLWRMRYSPGPLNSSSPRADGVNGTHLPRRGAERRQSGCRVSFS